MKKFKDKDIQGILDSINDLEELTKALARFLAEANNITDNDDEFIVKTRKGDIHIPIPVLLEIERYLGHRLEFMAIT